MKKHNEQLPALTKGEESVMQILWTLGDGLVYDIIGKMADPKPKYSTVATFIKMLETKGYVIHREEGRFYRYYPTFERDNYAQRVLKNVLNTYFDNQFGNLMAFYIEREKPSTEELGALAVQINAALEQE
ncbi:MAG: BlaI/MecI/CopY family transcriptional regulator [Rikenellaceae bacterium]|nr:BlaI/MecI/CopY family transcriptional regulator [Rikenellaceae bacterium]MBP3612904.1 BlaI/MecI/CopY family transcriptional regulator [Rikenellaceae bacterium]MBP3683326.1 BlaI/MecI/CopY family transcriptional regulator [Rikenellaceae bacterium]MBQ3254177.1 BlaI/MecI/CopY family transcriptional regulator [Rikenellaceae bacterium]MBQ6690342.1 BlaI/MecI/CopY family transcriptional regulator [Rikenellaceae bacterium]